MHIILSWLRLGDGSPVPRIPIFFSLKNAGAPVPATPSKNCLTASITVGHATGREHVQVCVPTVSGVRESTDGIGSTPMPATQPHPLVMVGHAT